MTVIGMIHHKRKPDQVPKAYALQAVAKMEGMSFFYFTYEDIDFEQERISGWTYSGGNWRKQIFPFPEVVINSSKPQTKEQSKIIKKLRGKCLFTSNPVGNKMKMYKKILKGKKYASYLIPSKRVRTVEDVLQFLSEKEKGVLKPYQGHKGEGIYFLKKEGDIYLIRENEHLEKLDNLLFAKKISSILEGRKWFIQPYICCQTKLGLTYDFRLHVQKNGEGKWEINLIYPRISANKYVSNISRGGYRGEFIPFLMEEFPNHWVKVKDKLERFAINFPTHFESLYPYFFDELGIDIGIDQEGKFWLFEVNWRPGSKNREFEVAKRLIPYCRYLVAKQGEKMDVDENK